MANRQSTWVNEQTWKSGWEKLETLDGGGQGEAYRARRKSDGKIGFLKVIKSKNDAERRARFFREATAYDSFGVEGIPRLIESNAQHHSDFSMTPFIVTDFISGMTLRKWRESQDSVTLESAVEITKSLLSVLEDCHAQGCVHRDVKPDNIILEDGEVPRLWLLDFGISHHDFAGVDFKTEDWQEIGNRFIRLPELSAGSFSKQDPRSDICFAAGILFYLLTGDHPDILDDVSGRLPHQRSEAFAKLHQAASKRLHKLLSVFDGAFATRIADRFSNAHAMRTRIDWMMEDQTVGSSPDENLAALRDILSSKANRQLNATVGKINEGLNKVEQVFDQVSQALSGDLVISRGNSEVTNVRGETTFYWSRPSSTDRIFSTTLEVLPSGDEIVIRLSGEVAHRTDFDHPAYHDEFQRAVHSWLVSRLLAILSDPDALAPEAYIFREIQPRGSLKAAAEEAGRTNRQVLAFVYDPLQPERGKLEWALKAFLENRRTRDLMNRAFVTALVPLAAIKSTSDILNGQSMETARWVLFDQNLSPYSQQVIYANPREGERIMESLTSRNPKNLGPTV